MDNNPTKKRSILDEFFDEIDNEYSDDTSNDEKSMGEMSVEKDSIIKLQDSNMNESDNHHYNTFTSIDDAFETIHGDNEFGVIHTRKTSEELQTNCMHLINESKSLKYSIEIEELRCKYALLESESQVTINKLLSQVAELNLQLKQQLTHSSMIGSVFSSYLWKATTIPGVVDLVLEQGKLGKMVNLMTIVLSYFIEAYNNNMTSIKTCEGKFILNILGIIANLTTKEGGRHFFSRVNDGIKAIELIISLVICAPRSQENTLKKIAYAILYNVSIQFNGHLLMENNKLVEILNNDIKALSDKNINDTIIFALKLLHSLTINITESMYIILKDEIKLEEILKLTRNSETELIARKIYENINIAREKYEYNNKCEFLST